MNCYVCNKAYKNPKGLYDHLKKSHPYYHMNVKFIAKRLKPYVLKWVNEIRYRKFCIHYKQFRSTNDNIHIIKSLCENKKHLLTGKQWISKSTDYEKHIAEIFDMQCESERYWDAYYEFNNEKILLEFKKGCSMMWFDEVRYSEILLNVNNKASLSTITLQFIPSKCRTYIESICIIDTKKLLKYMQLTFNDALHIIKRYKKLNNHLNCQQSITNNILKSISEYVVTHTPV